MAALMASPPPVPTSERIRGLSFAPEEDQLITMYLGPKIAGQPLPAAAGEFIHDADVYAADPASLCAKFPPAFSGIEESSRIWYFFNSPRAKNSRGSRKSRTVGEGEGTWHAEGRKDVFEGEDHLVGYRRSFSHKTSRGERSGWLMWEYGFGGNQEQESAPVLCKIYRTKTKDGCSTSTRKKRKAKHDERSGPAAPSARVRRRLQFSSPPVSNPPPARAEFPEQESAKQHSEPAPVRRKLQFCSPPASNSPPAATPQQDFLSKSSKQHSEPPASNPPPAATPVQDFLSKSSKQHSEPAFDPIQFLANGLTHLPIQSCESTIQGDLPIAESSSWNTGMESFADLPIAESSSWTTGMESFTDWASPVASKQYSQVSNGSCTSGAEFLQSLPVTGFEQEASFSWPVQPSFAPTASSAASTPLRNCLELQDLASPMLLPLQCSTAGFEQDAAFYWPAQPSSVPTASLAASTSLHSCLRLQDWASPMLPPLQGGWMPLC